MGIDKRMVYFLRNNITETERKNTVAAGLICPNMMLPHLVTRRIKKLMKTVIREWQCLL